MKKFNCLLQLHFKIILILCLSKEIFATEFSVQKQGENIQIQINNIEFKNISLAKEFKSGLKNHLLYYLQVKFKDGNYTLFKQSTEIRFDLWDEEYLYKEDTSAVKKTKDVNDLLNKTSNLKFNVPKGLFEKIKSEPFEFILDIYINPIKKEKAKVIKEWMAERYSGQPTAGKTPNLVSGMVNKLISDQLEKDVYGSDHSFNFESQKFYFKDVK